MWLSSGWNDIAAKIAKINAVAAEKKSIWAPSAFCTMKKSTKAYMPAHRKMKQINRKIDSSRDFKKDKKYDFLQNFNIGEASTKKV